jgi:hypothetical protein
MLISCLAYSVWKHTHTHCFNHLKRSDYYMYHLILHKKSLHTAKRVYLCVSYDFQNKQLLTLQITLIILQSYINLVF